MKSKVLQVLIYCMVLSLMISCKPTPKKRLETFIKPYIKKEYKHLLVVPQIYCKNCIRTLFEKVENHKLKQHTGILFLEIATNIEVPSGVQSAKYNDYCKATQDKNTDLIWIKLANDKIESYQKLNSVQFYEHLPQWIE